MSPDHAPASSSCSSPEPSSGGGSHAQAPPRARQARTCRVPGCPTQLERGFHWKYRVCKTHAQVPSIALDGSGVLQRFCQQCSKFHTLEQFDGERRSCRASLGRHQERRRRKREQPAAEEQGGKRKSGAEQGKQVQRCSQTSGGQRAGGKPKQQGASQRSTAAQPVQPEGQKKRRRPRKPRAAPKPAQQQQQQQPGPSQQQQQQQQAGQQQQGQARSPPAAAAAQQHHGHLPPPQPAQGAANGSAAPSHPAPWPAAGLHPASADPCSTQWQASRAREQHMATAVAAVAPLPGRILPPAAPAAALEGASGHGSTDGLGLAGDDASWQAEIEALLLCEEPLPPPELQGMQPDSSSWLGTPGPPGWQGGPAAAAAAGLGGAAAAQPLLLTTGSCPWIPVPGHVASAAQHELRHVPLLPPSLPPASSSLVADGWPAWPAPIAWSWGQQPQLLSQPAHMQQQQQAVRLTTAAWGGGPSGQSPAVHRPATAPCLPAGPAALAPPSTGPIQVPAARQASAGAAAAEAAPPPARPYACVTTGSDVQPWNAAWWQAR